MERECPETRSDLEIMCTWATDPVKRPILFDQLLVFACANAFQNLAENESRLDNIKRWATLRTNFSDFLSNYPERVSDARLRVLKHMPDPSKWPDGFVEHAMSKINKSPTKVEARAFKNMSDDQMQACVAGKRIEELAKAAQSIINNRFNPHYSADLPSGYQNDIAMLRLVRRYQWHEKSVELATNAVRRDLFTKKKDGTTRLVLGDGFTKLDAIEKAYLRRMRTMTYDWYPGRPAGEDRMSALFNSGVASKILSDGLGPQPAAASVGNKHLRKRLYSTLNKEVSPAVHPEAASSSSGLSNTSANSAQQLSEEINLDRLAITLLEKEVSLAESFGENIELVAQLKRDLYEAITACRRKVQSLQRDHAMPGTFTTPIARTSLRSPPSSSSMTAEL
jgi:hypothetical protein